MKTFLFEIPRLLRVKSKELDVTAALMNRSWVVFNDEGVKQVFVFLDGGKVLVSTNGRVSYSQWSYIAVNQALVISTDNKGLMFHPAFVDDKVFAFQLDGSKEVLFMIDESAAPSFVPKTLSDLKAYFVQAEKVKMLPQYNTKPKEVIVDQPSGIPVFYEEVIKENNPIGFIPHVDPNVLSSTEMEETQKKCERIKRWENVLGWFFLILSFLVFVCETIPNSGSGIISVIMFLAIAITLFVSASKVSSEKEAQKVLSQKKKSA